MSSTNKTEHYNLPQFIGSDIPTWLGDFNSAMTAIDSGINAAATSASGAATTAAQALTEAAAAQKAADYAANRCPFPIGYGGFFQTDPNTIYPATTWQQKKDVFILASGTAYPAGSTGGEAEHILKASEIPPHSHVQKGLDSNMVTSFNIGGDQTAGRSIDNFSDYITGYVIHTANEGGGLAHNNMPPFYSMPFWIRTA